MKNTWMGSLLVALSLAVAGARAAGDGINPPEAFPSAGVTASADGAKAPAADAKAPAPASQPAGSSCADQSCCAQSCCASQPCCGCCQDSSRGGGLYGGFDYLLWWFKKGSLPPLVTHGDPNDTPTGALGQPGTTVLFGGDRFGSNPFSGARFTVGAWLGDCQDLGVETTWLFLEQRRQFFSASGTGDVGTGSLNVVFFNGDGGFEDSFPQVALEGTSSGNINIRLVQRLWGGEVNARKVLACGDSLRLSALAGFRYLSLQESLDLEADSTALPADLGISTAVAESFGTRNNIYLGQIGAQADACFGNFRVSVLGKVGLGGNDESVKINGTTTNTDPINGTVVATGGFFSGPNNVGNHHGSDFVVVPEVGVNLGYKLTCNLTATVGYDFLYVSNVVRPGDQLDRTITFQTNDRPKVLFHTTDFWAQGINFGLQYRF
jgi:hypothetical protein